MSNTLPPMTVSVIEASKLTGLSRSRLYELMQDGKLKSLTIGRRRLIRVSALEALLDEAA